MSKMRLLLTALKSVTDFINKYGNVIKRASMAFPLLMQVAAVRVLDIEGGFR